MYASKDLFSAQPVTWLGTILLYLDYVYKLLNFPVTIFLVSGYVGKWRDPLHFAIRSQCINTLAKLYSGIPLQYCDTVLTAFSDFTRLRERY